MKPTGRLARVLLLLACLLPLLLIVLVDQDKPVETQTVEATQASSAVPFNDDLNGLTTTTAAPTTTTTAPPTTTTEYIPPTTTTVPPAPPTTEAPQSYSGPYSADWDAVAQCESGGNWHINTGNGYYGGLQFDLQTWRSVGGTGYPHEHSREEQIHRAELLYSQRGLAPWPNCGKYG